jgi:hypothetical protein
MGDWCSRGSTISGSGRILIGDLGGNWSICHLLENMGSRKTQNDPARFQRRNRTVPVQVCEVSPEEFAKGKA